jgi:hypothetical protein
MRHYCWPMYTHPRMSSLHTLAQLKFSNVFNRIARKQNGQQILTHKRTSMIPSYVELGLHTSV